MSYCRWDDDSDVYCYRGGDELWIIMISPTLPKEANKEYIWLCGATLNAYDLYTLRSQFEALQKIGFRFPLRVFERIKREMNE